MRGYDPAALDRYITGNYGEDQFNGTEDKCPLCIQEIDGSEPVDLDNIPDGMFEIETEEETLWLCLDHYNKWKKDRGEDE